MALTIYWILKIAGTAKHYQLELLTLDKKLANLL
jgi:hypothetical protein